jgi:hypothetical protein
MAARPGIMHISNDFAKLSHPVYAERTNAPTLSRGRSARVTCSTARSRDLAIGKRIDRADFKIAAPREQRVSPARAYPRTTARHLRKIILYIAGESDMEMSLFARDFRCAGKVRVKRPLCFQDEREATAAA